MKLADKIVMLRKQNGWSQEELADRLAVTRQSVSKWEGAQSVPELEKIVAMSRLFGVSTDFLLKEDEAKVAETGSERQENASCGEQEAEPIRTVPLDEVVTYLDRKKEVSVRMAIATALCVLSPSVLLALAALSEQTVWLSEAVAAGVGLLSLLAMVAVAVALFIVGSSRLEGFSHLGKGDFCLEPQARELAEARWLACKGRNVWARAIGTVLCVLSIAPLSVAIMIGGEGYALVFSLPLLLVFVSVGVFLFVFSDQRWGAARALLEREKEPNKKVTRAKVRDAIESVYWLVVLAIYLGYSFVGGEWGESWVIWPVAVILFSALSVILNLFGKKK